MHVTCEWLGHAPAVAAKHYLQVTDAHYAQAAQEAAHNPAQRASARGRTGAHGERETGKEPLRCGSLRPDAPECAQTGVGNMGPVGFEPTTKGL